MPSSVFFELVKAILSHNYSYFHIGLTAAKLADSHRTSLKMQSYGQIYHRDSSFEEEARDLSTRDRAFFINFIR